MGFRCGIIGLPNVGKSTIFNALTKGHALCAPYPFTTIEPNVGIVSVPDERLQRLSEIISHDKIIPTTIEFVDLPGLVEGASLGEGLGNQFLAKVTETDVLAHVVRCFENPNTVHTTGLIDPIRDVDIIEHELMFKDIETLDRLISRIQKSAKSPDKKLETTLAVAHQLREKINKAMPARLVADNHIKEILNTESINLLTIKPLFYVVNISEEDIKMASGNAKKIADYARSSNTQIVFICGKIEEELIQLEPDDRQPFMQEAGLQQLGLINLIKTGYNLLNLITFFTIDSRQLRAWTISKGTKAPQAAGRIHSDFQKGFIRAEVISFKDLIASGSEHSAKEKGLMKLEGKEYIICDGDVIHFRFQS